MLMGRGEGSSSSSTTMSVGRYENGGGGGEMKTEGSGPSGNVNGNGQVSQVSLREIKGREEKETRLRLTFADSSLLHSSSLPSATRNELLRATSTLSSIPTPSTSTTHLRRFSLLLLLPRRSPHRSPSSRQQRFPLLLQHRSFSSTPASNRSTKTLPFLLLRSTTRLLHHPFQRKLSTNSFHLPTSTPPTSARSDDLARTGLACRRDSELGRGESEVECWREGVGEREWEWE